MNIYLEWFVKCLIAGTIYGLVPILIQYVSYKLKLSDETIFNK